MNVLKAYSNASSLGQSSYPPVSYSRSSQGGSGRDKKSGDFLNISAEAMELMNQSNKGSISVMPQDATYDQHGHVTRQLDSLQGELHHLAAQFMTDASTLGMLGDIGRIQSRLTNIRAQV